jgi:glycosyltransferase involved in cell wall biosynthesis
MTKTICFFNSTKEWGGGEKWHHDIALQMHKDGHNVVVYTNENSELFKRLKDTGIKLISLKISNLSFLNPFKVQYLKNSLTKNNVTHIILNLSADLKIAGFASKKAGIKHIIYRRGSAIPIKNSFLNRYIFKNLVTNIIANTEATKITINQNNPSLFPNDKIKVIYNGIDLKNFDNQNTEPTTESTNNQIIIGNIGRLVKQKAQHYLIELGKELKSKNIDYKIIIGGKGKLEEELKNHCKRESLEKEIIFTGFVSNPKSFLLNVDVFVLTSLWEGFGYVLVEAMACEKPTIAFDISSNPEITDNNETGFLVKFKDISSIAEKIIYLTNNPDKIKKLGKNGREKVEKLFTLEQTYKNVIEYLQSLN